MGKSNTINIQVGDMSGQRDLEVNNLPVDASWGEALGTILGKMSLPSNAPDGGNAVWSGRVEKDGRHLRASEIVGDVLENGDRVVLQRDINAGKR